MPEAMRTLETQTLDEPSDLRARMWRLVREHTVPWLDRATASLDADAPLVERALQRIEPTLSLRQIRARVVAVRSETHDVKTFVLRPNGRFTTFRPGSYVTVSVVIGGRTLARSYSISSAPSRDGLIALTVKRVPGGVVSNWLADEVGPGHVLELSAPSGQFVLPDILPPRLLMISAGSGITPMMSMVRSLIANAAPVEISFLHFARSPRDVIFRDELMRLDREVDNVRVALCVERSEHGFDGAEGRFCEELLAAVEPAYRELDTYLCGPSPFMQTVVQTFERSGADLARLRYERFGTDFDASLFLEHAQVVRFLRTGAERIASRPRTILEEAESLGLNIPSGCRAGNCGTCRCRKRSGVVVDVVTGLASKGGEEFIYPCISVPRGTVEIDL